VNEELKIIISAVTAPAQENIKKVNGELKKLEGQSKSSSGKAGGALKGMGKAFGAAAIVATAAITAIIGAVVALTAALSNLSKSTKEYREEQAKLNTAFLSAGGTAEQAAETYNDLYRFLGDSSKATEAAGHLAKLTTEEQALAQWTTSLQGVYATFGDSLPIESLTEAANETARVGKVTGTMADALNWAGVNEDAFNAQLEKTNSLSEREALIRGTLNGLYSDAARIYEQNNQEIIQQNEAQARLDATMGRLGKVTTPLATAFTNLSNAIMVALGPAIEWLANGLTVVINALTRAVQWVSAFIGVLGGGESAKGIANTKQIASNISSTSAGADKLAGGLGAANKAAEKLKKTTAGFDELNVISSPTKSAGAAGGGAGAGGAAGGGLPLGDFAIGDSLTSGLDNAGAKFSEFGEKVKGVFTDLKNRVVEWATLFTPTFEAWKTAFSGLIEPFTLSFESIKTSIGGLWSETLAPFSGYLLEEFIPTITNSFSENFAPIFTDVMSAAVTQFAADFEWGCQKINELVNDVVVPAMDLLKTITTDTFDIIGDEWEKSGDDLLKGVQGFVESIKGIWDNLYNNILKPAWDVIVGALREMWEKHLKDLVAEIVSFASKVGTAVTTIWNNFLAPIVNWIITVLAPVIVGAVESIMDVVDTIIGIVSGVVKGVLKALGGLMDFITGVFSGNWKLAWQGIKDFFKGIWDGIWSICKGIVNLIIDGINGLWTGIYNVIKGLVNGIGSIAGAIGSLFGQDWKFSMPSKPAKIPKLATGGIVRSATVAMVGEAGKEAVLPLENNTEWMDKLADKIAGRQTTPSKIVLMLNEKELGWANINSINSITRQTGELQLAFV
jgi:phage-related protein